MKRIVISLILLMAITPISITSAEETKDAPKPDLLKQCQVEKQTLASVLVDLAHQINREMEIAHLRLKNMEQGVK